MTATRPAPAKDHLFGVFAAIGEDFGFDPLWLRIAFAVALLFNLEAVIGAYLALGAVVLVSRLLFRDPQVAAAAPAPVAPVAAPIEEEPLRQAA